MSNLKNTLLLQSDDKLDKSLKKIIEKWDGNNITALQLFEVIDIGNTYQIIDDNILKILHKILDVQLFIENKTMLDLCHEADWWTLSGDISNGY